MSINISNDKLSDVLRAVEDQRLDLGISMEKAAESIGIATQSYFNHLADISKPSAITFRKYENWLKSFNEEKNEEV